MSQVSVQHQRYKTLQSSLYHLHEAFINAGDEKQAEKIIQLLRKQEKEEFVIAFCGHFSAGKSSMINELMGQTILPASPIPTSANLVSVKAGEEHATVYYRKEKPVRYEAPYEYEQIKSFCVDGDEVESIHLSIETEAIPQGIVVMDTPGIDSTDDAHRVSTESALHLADVIFYVMDYNHVQAELNFHFTKELQDANKELFLIINQVDKHRDDQLTFQEFKESVEEAFLKWNVRPKGIFYTSLKDKQYPYNELAVLKKHLHTMMEKKENRGQHIMDSMKMVVEDHMQFAESTEEESLLEYDDIRSQLRPNEYQNAKEEAAELIAKREMILHKRTAFYTTYQNETAKIMNNANLAPYEMREKAKAFLETTKPDFKVGVWFTKKKTEEEKKERLTVFYEDLKERVQTELQWHLQQYMQQLIQDEELVDSSLLASVQQFEVPFEPHDLVDAVKTGATINGEYVLTYTKDVVDAIKKNTNRILSELYTQIEQVKKEEEERILQNIEQSLATEQRIIEGYERVQKSTQHLQTLRQDLKQKLNILRPLEPLEMVKLLDLLQEEIEVGTMVEVKAAPITVTSEQNVAVEEEVQSKTKVDAVIRDIDESTKVLSTFKQLEKFVGRLKEKRHKLANQTFTVALFGAFSAGKSSFANALIGEKVLPVSPNPTTATINKIMPPTKDYPHRTVVVLMKTMDQLLADINSSLELFKYTIANVEELNELLPKLTVKEENQLHFSFLQAVIKGYEDVKDVMGSEVNVTIKEFEAYVAKEEKACFVQHINLYYDCELTQLGITLVDTPGADSINARHTGVAFEYIKNADAILFVTYYNHAFSKADREFLIQLGRVKDVFTLDKMFFLLNAADLAQSDEELGLVQNYVKTQLEEYDIRFPRLYPISSLQALANREDKMFKAFQKPFYHFITDELTQLAVASVYEELNQALAVTNEIKDVQTKSAVEKQRYLQSLHIKDQQISAKVSEMTFTYEEQQLERESNELLFYVKKRVLQRYDDFFKESFNPATLRDDKGNKKEQLAACLDQLLQAVAFDVTQEIQATTLRLETFIQRLTKEWNQTNMRQLQRYEPTFHPALPDINVESGSTLVSRCSFENLELFQKDLALYKNSKSFFEKNEKAKMHEGLKAKIEPLLDDYVCSEQIKLQNHYNEQIHMFVLMYKPTLLEEWHDYYKQLQTAVNADFPIEALNHTIDTLNVIVVAHQNERT
ncbi:dynamin family protein [Priestia flexa]|uniref:dynamin family protein n=1 Tax=Priestia flexa TaxID=86664 RepID=UPI0010FC34FA|nr:dynamin family protein [Priestia flexa]QCS53577.1 GTPase [Priestia flexa]